MKPCISCSVPLPLEAFYVHPRMKDGHLNKCKTCVKAAVRERYRADPAKRKAYEQERQKRPERRASTARSLKRCRKADPARYRGYHLSYWARNPLVRPAQNAVHSALRRGTLAQGPCEECGALEVHGHHDDYTRPLEVRWLCRAHHVEWHRSNTPRGLGTGPF